MTTLQTLSQLPAVPRSSAALGGPGRSGLTMTGAEGRKGSFESFLTAPTVGEAEAPGVARNLARLQTANMHNEMLANLLNQGGDENRSASLVERANLEALLSSGRFGNLLGGPKGSGLETGLTMNARALNSWRQKNGALSLGQPATAEEAMRPVTSPGLAYLIRPPQRLNPARVEIQETPPEQPAPPPAASVQKADVQTAAAAPATEAAAEGAAGQLTSDQLDKLVQKVALALNMDPHLIKAVIKTESNFNPQAVSKAGAKGLMQLMPATAKELGVKDPFNPVENIWAGARYLKKMLDRHSGNINNALASYNWGPGNFDRHGGMRLPGETKRYITTVNKHYAKLKQNNAFSA
jgi:soluble lytic murein transglycosylase-like protein